VPSASARSLENAEVAFGGIAYTGVRPAAYNHPPASRQDVSGPQFEFRFWAERVAQALRGRITATGRVRKPERGRVEVRSRRNLAIRIQTCEGPAFTDAGRISRAAGLRL
jgi:hypothetical protein